MSNEAEQALQEMEAAEDEERELEEVSAAHSIVAAEELGLGEGQDCCLRCLSSAIAPATRRTCLSCHVLCVMWAGLTYGPSAALPTKDVKSEVPPAGRHHHPASSTCCCCQHGKHVAVQDRNLLKCYLQQHFHPPSSSATFVVNLADLSLCRWRTCWSTTCSVPPPPSLRQSACLLAVATWRSPSGCRCLHDALRCGSGWLHLHSTPWQQQLLSFCSSSALPPPQPLPDSSCSIALRLSHRPVLGPTWHENLRLLDLWFCRLTLPGPNISLTAA